MKSTLKEQQERPTMAEVWKRVSSLQTKGDQLYRFVTMPLFYNGLVVEKTTRCNAKCGMCYQSAGPKGSDLLGNANLQNKDIARLLLEAAEIDVIHPRFHLAGGEAFLDVDGCLELFQIAKISGFTDITTTTNAYWAKSKARANDIAFQLQGAGLTGIEVSWDFWHLPYIQPSVVENCIRACREVNIEVNLRILSTKSHSYHEALEFLSEDALAHANRITCGPVIATGRAEDFIGYDDIHGAGDLETNCHSMLNLTVNPNGDIYPCCAGFEYSGARIFGNIRERPLTSILESMNRSPLLRTLVLGGVSQLRRILESYNVTIGTDYNSICHMCWSIFSDPERVKILKSYFMDFERRALKRATELAKHRRKQT